MAEGGYIDMKCRVNGVLEKCSGELHEIERRIMTDGSSVERSDLLITVREMLGALETGLMRQEDDGARSKRMRSDPGTCTHTCVHHPEIMSPGLWSKLPEELVGLVFARLPIPRIIKLRKSSEAWTAMSHSASFKGAFAEANPKLFGLMGWDCNEGNFRTRILDPAFKKWHGIKSDFPKGRGYKDFFLLSDQYDQYGDTYYDCDGGLVCFVPEEEDKRFDCVFVGNPLTDVWRKLSNIPYECRESFVVQLVTDELFYRVILVYCKNSHLEQDAQTLGAFVYDSRVGSWSVMATGLVYGACNSLVRGRHVPVVYDCGTKELIFLEDCVALQDLVVLRCSILKDRLFVLHKLFKPQRFVISEFVWESSKWDLRKLNDHEVALLNDHEVALLNDYEVALRNLTVGSYGGRDDVEIFTRTGFILSALDILPELRSARRFIKIYDVSAGRWRILPPLIGDRGIQNQKGLFMCELRWDANP